MTPTILWIDDDREILRLAQIYLSGAYRVVGCEDPLEALPLLAKTSPSLAVLDVMMPHQDGWALARELTVHSPIPFLFLTAKSQETDRVRGLSLGADDYVTKPFSFREIRLRIERILRRNGQWPDDTQVRVGDLTIDTRGYTVSVNHHPIRLTPTEYKVLLALVQNLGRVLTRDQLLNLAEGQEFSGYDRTIDAHIAHLRRKLTPSSVKVVAVYGVGYTLHAK